MGETASEKADRLLRDLFALMHIAHKGGLETVAEMIAANLVNRDDALKAQDSLLAIRAAFKREERAALLERALTLMIVRALEAGDCPHVISVGAECPHDSMEQPERKVCEECFRDWALKQAKEDDNGNSTIRDKGADDALP